MSRIALITHRSVLIQQRSHSRLAQHSAKFPGLESDSGPRCGPGEPIPQGI